MLRIAEERMKRSWSKAEYARRADLNQATVFATESGRLKPWPGQLLKMATALDWPPERAQELLEEVDAEK